MPFQLLLAIPIIAVLVLVAGALRDRFAARTPRTTEVEALTQELNDAGPKGWASIIRGWLHEKEAETPHLTAAAMTDARELAAEAEATRLAAVRRAWGEAQSPNPALVGLVFLLTALGIAGFLISVSLDVGLGSTMKIGGPQGIAVGLVAACSTAVIALMFAEVAIPHATAGRWGGRGGLRVGLLVMLFLAFATLVGFMAVIAPTRATIAHQAEVDDATALCLSAQQNPRATIAQRTLMCDSADRAANNMKQAVMLDQVAAVSGPAAELVGGFGWIQFAELAQLWAIARRSRKARARVAALQSALESAWAQRRATLLKAAGRAGVPAELPNQVLASFISTAPSDKPAPPAPRPATTEGDVASEPLAAPDGPRPAPQPLADAPTLLHASGPDF